MYYYYTAKSGRSHILIARSSAMNRYLLLILLTSWSLLVTESCDTGVAFVNSVLSVGRSSLANADVALLETYAAETVEKCMEDCCAGIYGACSVASFKKNATKKNCQHFYCRPLKQCKFLSSSSTDSFTFSSNSHALHPVPSSNHFTTSSSTTAPSTTTISTTEAKFKFEQPQAVEEIATFSEEQADLKNDNTSIKARKGVDVLRPDVIPSKPGVKPRKGVTLEDVPHSKFLLKSFSKSNVKPRKGVGNYSSAKIFTEEDFLSSNNTQVDETLDNANYSKYKSAAIELASELANVFLDDSITESTTASHSATPSKFYTISSTPVSYIIASSSSAMLTVTSDMYMTTTAYEPTLSSSDSMQSSFSSTPALNSVTSFTGTTTRSTLIAESSSTVMMPIASAVPSLSARAHLSMDEPKSLEKTLATKDSEESENSKKYTSSMHLVLSLVFGLLVLFGVIGVVAKRMYDSWQRRDYYRMNYLIDGIYNGYE